MTPSPERYERLGSFYLGRRYDLEDATLSDEPYVYDARDLTTHGVCVGMTGSGKTGLCVSLLEEAALDGIPALVIDPKGDLTNLLLTFPELRPADFEPWVDPAEAQRAGKTKAQFAAAQARLWKNGLAEWGQTGERIARLRSSADFQVYTPGSDAGRGLSVLSSFRAPGPAIMQSSDLLREQIGIAATSLLGLVGIDADPIRSREHILIAQLIEATWQAGQDLDLPRLIALVQSPPIRRIGALDLDAFFPATDRFELALALNNLLAAPGFAAWMRGDPLDMQHLLYTPEGRPRTSIVYIAHLSEAERMFVVTQLVNQMVSWMRGRSGTASLRALLYMDEIFGYLPPVAEPPSKRPLLTLLKQGRAYGVGALLATQNPVDLDYKALSNAGTWFLGRLQTERDMERVIEGLESADVGASAAFDRSEIERLLAGLGKRKFLVRNIHEPEPTVFHTRWAMSYLRGPLTRDQVRQLNAAQPEVAAPAPSPTAAPPQSAATVLADAAASTAPILPPGIEQRFLLPRLPATGAGIVYAPYVLALADVHFVDTRKGLSAGEKLGLVAEIDPDGGLVDWDGARQLQITPRDLRKRAPQPGTFADLPAAASTKKAYGQWKRQLSDWAYRSRRYPLYRCPSLDATSTPGQSEAEFRLGLVDEARSARDLAIAKLRTRYEKRFATLRERIRKAQQALDREREQAQDATMQTAISVGTTLLSAVLGRSTLGRAGTTARGAGYAMRQRQDIGRARDNVAKYQEQLAAMESGFEVEIDAIRDAHDPARLEIETFELRPRRTDIDVSLLALTWVPCEADDQGVLSPLA
jgi:hypothetical protein